MAKKPKLEIFTSYLKTIENSVNSNIFRNLYYKIGRKTIDVLDDGDLSCANYVTTILYIFGLIKELGIFDIPVATADTFGKFSITIEAEE